MKKRKGKYDVLEVEKDEEEMEKGKTSVLRKKRRRRKLYDISEVEKKKKEGKIWQSKIEKDEEDEKGQNGKIQQYLGRNMEEQTAKNQLVYYAAASFSYLIYSSDISLTCKKC